jgi:drug/metabolite transporter (DMT)-like permease
MLERVGLPVLFVVLWSSAFVAAKSGVVYATPFAFLAVRFAIVAAIFASVSAALYVLHKASMRPPKVTAPVTRQDVFGTVAVGILLHGIYLGCSFYAMANGLGAALTALIVSTQPLLTTALAIVLFGEKPRGIQWLGIAIGFIGVIVVLSPSLGISAPILSLLASLLALIAITCGTLLQKKVGNQIGLLKSNVIQASAATLFFLILINTIEVPHIDWTPNFVGALAWQVLVVSTGAYIILMILIKRDSVAATTSLLFLVPPTTALIAHFWLGEPLTPTTIAGFCMASAGVYLVTRYAARSPS